MGRLQGNPAKRYAGAVMSSGATYIFKCHSLQQSQYTKQEYGNFIHMQQAHTASKKPLEWRTTTSI